MPGRPDVGATPCGAAPNLREVALGASGFDSVTMGLGKMEVFNGKTIGKP
jgi:hypothetical protein